MTRYADKTSGNPDSERMHSETSHTASLLSANDEHVQELVKMAHEELCRLLSRRAELVKRIGMIKQTIAGLVNLLGNGMVDNDLLELVDGPTHGKRSPGLTKTCRAILREAKRPMTVREVCDEISAKAPDILSRHKDASASVTTVLNRLAEYGQAEALLLETGRRAWQWRAEHGPSYTQSDSRQS